MEFLLDMVSTRAHLSMHEVVSDIACSIFTLCAASFESVNHLFVACGVAIKVLYMIFR